MNWYFKHDGTGDVEGPMAKGAAMNIADVTDGLVFSEELWGGDVTDTEGEPVSISEEVADLIEYLESLKDDKVSSSPSQCDRLIKALVLLSGQALTVDVAGLMLELDKVLVGDLRERTAKAFISFSAKKVVTVTTESVQRMLANLRDLKGGQKDASYWANKKGMGQIICQQAIDMILSLSAKKVIIGSIEGGVLSLDEVPDGVTVLIYDYDIEGVDAPPGGFAEDDDGRECMKLEFGD